MSAYSFHLMVTHRRLDDEIRRERARRRPDSLRLLRLKKLKLAIKDRIYRLSQGPARPALA